MRRLGLVLALALSAAGCGRGGAGGRTPIACEADCAAEALRLRLARSPRDREALEALAAIDEQRGRPGAALASLARAEALGRWFRPGVGGAARDRLARLLTRRASARAARGSPAALTDVRHLRRLGVAVSPPLVDAAERASILLALRDTDPRTRADGRRRLAAIDPALADALDGGADPATTERAAIWLASGPARRALHELLDRYADARGVAGFGATSQPGWMLDRWLEGRRWWRGADGRPDLATLERAIAAGADPCIFDVAGPARTACAARSRPSPAPPPAPFDLVDTSWPEIAVDLATAGDAADPLRALARAFVSDPALGDRAVEDFLAVELDLAAAAPVVARLMALLGDPARSRALWQRALDASPRDPALRLGLALACADAGDPSAALQYAFEAAAASGDAGATLIVAARVLAITAPPEQALTLARQAFELAPAGEEGPAAALAASLLGQLARPADATALRRFAVTPSRWDLADERQAIATWRTLAADPATRGAALLAIWQLARAPDPAGHRLAAAALRGLIE